MERSDSPDMPLETEEESQKIDVKEVKSDKSVDSYDNLDK